MRGRNIRWPLMKMGAKHEPFNKQREGGREGAETGSDNQTKDNYPLRKGMRRRVHTKITIAHSQSHFASLFDLFQALRNLGCSSTMNFDSNLNAVIRRESADFIE